MFFSQTENSLHTNSEFSNELDEENTTTSATANPVTPKEEQEQPESEVEEESDSEEYQPRIVQVTNFQQLTSENQSFSSLGGTSPSKSGKLIKQELTSDTEFRESLNNQTNIGEELDEDSSDEDNVSTTLSACKPSLFTKQPKRQWPWLIDNRMDDMNDDELEDKIESSNNTQ